MASISASQIELNPAPPDIAIYVAGVRTPSDSLGSLRDYVLSIAKKQPVNLVPTTYEESKAYLDQLGDHSDSFTEICMICVVDVPKNQEIVLVVNALGMFTKLESGSNICLSTKFIPPSAFGTRENRTSSVLLNTTTSKPVTVDEVCILMTYFTTRGATSGTGTGPSAPKKNKNKNKKKKKKKKGTGNEKGEDKEVVEENGEGTADLGDSSMLE